MSNEILTDRPYEFFECTADCAQKCLAQKLSGTILDIRETNGCLKMRPGTSPGSCDAIISVDRTTDHPETN